MTVPSVGLFHALYFFVQAHGDAMVAQMVRERFDNFLVGKLQQAGTFSTR